MYGKLNNSPERFSHSNDSGCCRIIPAPVTGNSPQMPTIAEGEMEGEYPHGTDPITDRERTEEETDERGMTMFDQKHNELINMQPEFDHSDGKELLHLIPYNFMVNCFSL